LSCDEKVVRARGGGGGQKQLPLEKGLRRNHPPRNELGNPL